MAAIESASSCGPQPYAQPPPPMAQAPNPTVVSSRSVDPNRRVVSVRVAVCMAPAPYAQILRHEDTLRRSTLSSISTSRYTLVHARGCDRSDRPPMESRAARPRRVGDPRPATDLAALPAPVRKLRGGVRSL